MFKLKAIAGIFWMAVVEGVSIGAMVAVALGTLAGLAWCLENVKRLRTPKWISNFKNGVKDKLKKSDKKVQPISAAA